MEEKKTRPDGVDVYVAFFGRGKSPIVKMAMGVVERHPQPGVDKDERIIKMVEYLEKYPEIVALCDEEKL